MLKAISNNFLFDCLYIIFSFCVVIFIKELCIEKDWVLNEKIIRSIIMIIVSILFLIVVIIIENAKIIFLSNEVHILKDEYLFFTFGNDYHINKHIYHLLYGFSYVNKNIHTLYIHNQNIDINRLKKFKNATSLTILFRVYGLDETFRFDHMSFLKKIKKIHCESHTISSLKGLSTFPNLLSFSAYPDNNITDIDEILLCKELIYIKIGYHILPYLPRLKTKKQFHYIPYTCENNEIEIPHKEWKNAMLSICKKLT